MNGVYFGGFKNKDEVLAAFDIPEKTLDGAEILFAAYNDEQYWGSALVLLRRGDDLYLVEGSHCSCYGLESQWVEDRVVPDMLKTMGLLDDRPEWLELVDKLQAKQEGREE